MTLLVYAAACLLLCAAAAMLRVVPRARREMHQFAGAFDDLRAPGLTDDEKERRARRAAIAALAGTGQLLLRLAGVTAAALAPVLLADAAGIVPAGEVGRFAVRLDVLVATTLVVAGAVFLVTRRKAGSAPDETARNTGRHGL
jgi:hypothetical protein